MKDSHTHLHVSMCVLYINKMEHLSSGRSWRAVCCSGHIVKDALFLVIKKMSISDAEINDYSRKKKKKNIPITNSVAEAVSVLLAV